jgi:hypothetical protein
MAFAGITTLRPERDLMEDRMSYGRAVSDAQKFNRPSFQEEGNTDRGPWLHSDVGDMLNPNVAERQYGLAAYPGAARKWAEMYNTGYDWDNTRFTSPKQFRDVANWANAINIAPNIIDPMYQNLDMGDGWSIEDEFSGPGRINTDMYKSKREQIEDEDNPFVANMMEMFGRDNPYTQELGETLTDDTYIDRGTKIRPSYDFGYNYAQNLDVADGTPPANLGFARAGDDPALPPANLGFARAGDDPALPPANLGFARAGPGSDMMDFVTGNMAGDTTGNMAGDTTGGMAGELIRNGIDTRGLNSDEIIQLYNQNFGNPDADVDQFGIAGVDEDNAAVRQMIKKGYTMEEIINMMAARPVNT